MRVLRGLAVSPGVAIGPPWVLDPRGLRLPPRAIAVGDVPAELERLEAGLAAARAEAETAEADAGSRLGPEYAAILGAHARMIDDPMLRRESRARIERDRIAAEHAVLEVLDGLAARLERLADSHLAARAADVRDVELRILDGLAGGRPAAAPAFLDGLPEPSVLLSHDLTPSQAAGLDPKMVLGFATEGGGQASHTAIVAAALEIPAVVGVGPFLPAARRCRTVIIDGDDGRVVLDPDAATLDRYRKAGAERARRFADLARTADLPAVTRDGTAIDLQGNIEFPVEVETCRCLGAGGIGLYRTEFLYLNALQPPSEEEQFAAYSAVVRAMGGRPVTIRTLDLGADKLLPAMTAAGPAAEANPSLGLRSLRLSLRDPSLFRVQLRAILRAGTLGDVRVMFPLVSTLEEFRRARGLLDEVARELADAGVPARDALPVGAMIEVPAAALTADKLAKEVDFFSIGTNDLIQYTLAADRTNEAVAALYSAADPSILRLIRAVVEAARPRRLPVNVCGTMGGEPLYAPLLIGLGLRQLSMPPHQLPEVKRVVRAVRLADAEALAAEVLALDTADEVLALLRESLRRTQADAETFAAPAPAPPARAGRRRGPRREG
jgi:phosphotransferase system enzyme I (PtsI)